MYQFLKCSDDLRRWLPKFGITDKQQKRSLLFPVKNLNECFSSLIRPLGTLRQLRRELLWSVARFGTGSRQHKPMLQCSIMTKGATNITL